MKKREIRRVLDKAVNALDGAHVVTGGPKGDSEEALAIKRRAEDMLRKGSKVAIEGKLRYSAWEAKDGTKRSKLEVVVDEVEFLSSRNQQGGQGQQHGQPAPSYPAPAYSAPAPAPQRSQAPVRNPPSADAYDEDIPF